VDPAAGRWGSLANRGQGEWRITAVVKHHSHPSVKLAAGYYRLEGAFRWNEIPQSIPLPREIGILALTIEGTAVESPQWDEGGVLWLKRETSSPEADRYFLGVKVYALLEDGIPLWLRSEIELIVSGKSREEEIGSILPAPGLESGSSHRHKAQSLYRADSDRAPQYRAPSPQTSGPCLT
jgi:hypothetical protein